MEDGVLFSIRPEWCELILSGEKTCEVRKIAPTRRPPYTGYIYCTNGKTLNVPITHGQLLADMAVNGMKSMNCPIGNGMVIGEFRVCKRTYIHIGTDLDGTKHLYNTAFIGRTCLTNNALFLYLQSGKGSGWALDFEAVKTYRIPKPLTDFVKPPCKKSTGCVGCKNWDRQHKACVRTYHITRPPQSWCYVWPAPF